MSSRYATPEELVDALRRNQEGAREHLRRLLEPALGRLMRAIRSRHGLRDEPATLVRHALHAVLPFLFTRRPGAFRRTSWESFEAALLLHVAQLADPRNRNQPGPRAPAGTVPASTAYESRALSLPFELIEHFRFGGDWYTGRHEPDGSLWVMVADITGHGYHASLLASGLPHLWQMCWEETNGGPPNPPELLTALHGRLVECLPESTYVEATLGHFHADGRSLVMAGGAARLLLRKRGESTAALLKLRGTWLGFEPRIPGDQHRTALKEGDEVLLASDGLFEQLRALEPGALDEQLRAAGPAASLFDVASATLKEALLRRPQEDDITMVSLRRRPGAGPGLMA